MRLALVVVLVGVAAEVLDFDPGGDHHLGAARQASASAPLTPLTSRDRRCPWAAPDAVRRSTPASLAREVVRHMDLAEELAFVDLTPGGGYENRTGALAKLCLPALTLQDGPNGLAFGDTGVTQLPASIGLAATFDPSLAAAYGAVEGAEARAQGVDVVQGPYLNIDRVPETGRSFEGYGEDPTLASAMGVADIEGIQSQGVLADAKHFVAYSQETDRRFLDQVVSERALEELYLPPFRAAVSDAHVASVMCAYGKVNGTYACEDPRLLGLLASWGFSGFVRSDLRAVIDPGPAFNAGIDLIKPGVAPELRADVSDATLARSRLDEAVTRVLEEMFAFDLVAHPRTGRTHTLVRTPAHAALSLEIAERSMVLLKNDGVLPLSRSATGGVAVIGADGGRRAMSAGLGSAHVVAPFLSTPYAAIADVLGRGAELSFSPAAASVRMLPSIPAGDLLPGTHNEPVTPGIVPLIDRRLRARLTESGVSATGPVTPADASALDLWRVVVRVPRTGLYSFSLTDNGDTWFKIDRRTLFAEQGRMARHTWTVTAHLVGGRLYHLSISWFPGKVLPPRLGWMDDTPAIDQAVRAARRARVALVFVNDVESEGFDRPGLSLPGDANALVSAVAAVNRHTVVVLNTGGAVLMPWIGKVAAVLEAWYPGEEDGAATASVLFGSFDPSGRLPVTFPASALPASPASFPGVDGTARFSEGLGVGYRYDELHHLAPLFPFGFGLSYTSFRLSLVSSELRASGVLARVEVTNTGHRAGTEVVEAYLSYPAAAGEPELQLKGFATIALRPGVSGTVTISVPASAMRCWLGGRWSTVRGNYALRLGSSLASLPLVRRFSVA